jgi:hypothetical protein
MAGQGSAVEAAGVAPAALAPALARLPRGEVSGRRTFARAERV